ncbi:MAG: ABC transporter permease subunit [Vicinamibacterales bacterium]
MFAQVMRWLGSQGAGTAFRLAPVLLIVVGLFGTGLVAAFVESISTPDAGALTGRYYLGVARDGEFWVSLTLTLWVAMASTAIATAAGVALALLLSQLATRQGLAYALMQFPLAVPHLAMAFVVLLLIAPSGWIARFGAAVGWISQPADFPALVYDRYGIGIILAYAAKEIPFLAIVTTALLVRIGPEYARVAATLGASRWQRLRYVTLPMLAPGIVSASLMVFAFVFAAFETPFLLGRPYPAMLSVVAERRYLSLDLNDRPDAIAWALVMTGLAAVTVQAYLALSRRVEGRGRPVVF